ncbi:hypothetical protein AMELA_G00150350 [Ameiurus melas]|uniref:Uncharacterized protein n=1 Tax=Ameiurus melas TaxID=219545 RepID=A0A7J6AHC3_AMEME|nr:hypothetical protein AMELA_G00150350 [Ameiurus melas]
MKKCLLRVPVHRRAQSHPFIHYGHFRHANQPTMHVFDLGRKPEYPEETPQHGENMQTDPGGLMWKMCPLPPLKGQADLVRRPGCSHALPASARLKLASHAAL